MKGFLKAILKPLQGEKKTGKPSPESSRVEVARKISHDIQGSFFGVTSVCALLKIAIEENQDTAELVGHMMRACHHYKFALSNFIEYYRYEAGLWDTIYEPIFIRRLIEKIIGETRETAQEKQVTLEYAVSEDMPEQIIGDMGRINLICMNLLDHALECTSSGNSIQIDIRRAENDLWSLRVAYRTGVAEDPDRIFELAGSGSEKMLKLNLFLFISRHLVENICKGRITHDKSLDNRVCLTATLPLR